MFGINPYSKAPFIALGAVFSNTISEAIGQTRNFIPQDPGIATLSMAGGPFAGSFSTVLYLDNPSYVVQSNLLNAINENINVTENYIDISQFLTSLNEAITFADSSLQSSQFISNIEEPITVTEIKSSTLATSFSIVEAWGQTPYSVSQKPSIASFAMAGSPFAGNFNTTGYLENPQYIVSTNAFRSVTENVTITNTQTVLSTFLNSIAENINLNDSIAQISTFSVSLTEPSTVDDVRVMNAGFAVNLNENSNLANAQSIAAQFVGAVFENINISNINIINAAYVQYITQDLLLEDLRAGSINSFSSITESITISDQSYIFLIDLIDIVVAQANQSFVDVYVYDAIALVDNSGIINTIEYNNITAVAELGEIGIS